jgi:hypothetical protein
MENKFELGNIGLNWEEQKMEDGEIWFHTTISNVPEDSIIAKGSIAVVTAEGKTLINANPSLFKKLLVFKRTSDKHKNKDSVRKILGGQGNGSVYALGKSGIAIKEASDSQSVHLATERMDRLYRLIINSQKDGIIPKWIDMPKYYGYLISPITEQNKHQYLMMEQIDQGVTVEDVISINERGEDSRRIIEQRLGYNLSNENITEIKEQWGQMKNFLETAISKTNLSLDIDQRKNFKEWIPDFHEGNIIVDKVNPPIDGRHFKLCIIDQ